MADNVNITAGAGVVIATDEDASNYHYQKIKLADGTANSTTMIYVDIGTKANALRVCPASNITDGTYIGDIKFGEALATVTNITSLDKSVYVDDADWTDNTSSHTLVGGIYQSAPHTVTDGDVSPFQLDVNGKILESNSAAILTALEIIDDWDDSDYCNVNLNVAGTDVAANSGVLNAQTIRVTIATDDECNNYLGTIDADTGAIKTAVESLDNAVDGNYLNTNLNIAGTDCVGNSGVLAAGVLRVTIATDDECNNYLGTIDADTGAIKTALEIIDDWDATHAAAAVADGPQIMGAGYSTALPTDVGADADAARICTDRYGRILRGIMPQNFQATMTSADAQAATPVKVKTASRKMYILSLIASTDTALNLQFQDDTGPTILIEGIYLAANGGFVMNWPPEAPLVVNTNEDFDVIASAAGNISVTITGYLAV